MVGFKNLGFELKVTASDQALWESLGEEPFDYLLLEAQELDGEAIARIGRLQTLYPQMRIILTGENESALRGSHVSVRGFFKQPIDCEKFFEFLKNTLKEEN